MMDLDAIDAALDEAKSRWDHGEAPYDPVVLALIRAAEQMRAAIPAAGDDPMPVFVIKAKDKLAVRAVRAYHDLCLEYGLGPQALEVLKAEKEMQEWRRRHRAQVKPPDHPHVPTVADPRRGSRREADPGAFRSGIGRRD